MGFLAFLKSLFAEQTSPSVETDLDAVEDIIGYHFRNRDHIRLALTHRSFHKHDDARRPSNERLEYLGDSVLDLVIAHQLYTDFPSMREGELTKVKAMLVNETTLSGIGKDILLNKHILLSPEEDKLGGRERSSIISDAFESVIGAVYLDGGLDAARDIVLRLIYVHWESITTDESQKNYKGELLELIQAEGNGMPRYDVVSETGPDHEKQFRVVVLVGNEEIGSGIGYSKKEAEQKAAAMALERYQDPSRH